MDARRVTRFSVQQQQQQEKVSQVVGDEQSEVGGASDQQQLVVATLKWPENGVLTLEWVREVGKTLDFASRNLLPSELPNVLPVSVIDSLLLAAHKVREATALLFFFDGDVR